MDLEDELHYLRTEIYQYPEADLLTKVLTDFEPKCCCPELA
jgi:DNA polymerase-3 subunit epsilon